MNFSHLSASMANNAGEEPTVYMAICMVKSLFRDIEAASGKSSISECPPGSESMPTELFWLCRTVQRIYSGASEEMVGNRKRLRDAIEELKSTEDALSRLSETAEELERVRSQADEKRAKLNALNEERLQIDALKKECDDIEAQLEQLRSFSKTEAAEKLKALREEKNRAVSDKAELEIELGRAQAEAKEAQARHEAIVGDIAKAKAKAEEAEGELKAKRGILDGYKTKLEAAGAERERILKELEEYTLELSNAQSQVDKLESGLVPERKKQLEDEKLRQAALEEELAAAEAQLRKLEEDSAKIEARLKEIDEKKERYAASRKKLEEAYVQADGMDMPGIEDKLGRNLERLALIKKARDDLAETISDVHRIVGVPPTPYGMEELGRIKDTVRSLTECTRRLRDDVINYARSVRLEEKQ